MKYFKFKLKHYIIEIVTLVYNATFARALIYMIKNRQQNFLEKIFLFIYLASEHF